MSSISLYPLKREESSVINFINAIELAKQTQDELIILISLKDVKKEKLTEERYRYYELLLEFKKHYSQLIEESNDVPVSIDFRFSTLNTIEKMIDEKFQENSNTKLITDQETYNNWTTEFKFYLKRSAFETRIVNNKITVPLSENNPFQLSNIYESMNQAS